MDSLHIPNSQYGGIYRGIVLSNTDNTGRGRMKVFVPSVYPLEFADGYDITKNGSSSGTYGSRLPWAEPAQPLFCGGSGENGMTQYPDIGTHVWVMFEAGNVQLPIVMGVIQQEKAKFENDKCIMHYGGMTVTFDKTTDTIYVDTNNLVVRSTMTDVAGTALVHIGNTKHDDITEKGGSGSGGAVNVDSLTAVTVSGESAVNVSSPDTVNISAPNGDCVLQNVSLVNHQHWEMQSGDEVSAKNTKTETAKNSL